MIIHTTCKADMNMPTNIFNYFDLLILNIENVCNR
jgi:hypothetical protein